MNDVITTRAISKNFGGVKAVNNVSLNVRKGEIYGFLGLNGAGKTTTIRMLLGMISPSSGGAFINGERTGPGNYRLLEKIGSLVEIPYSYPELTVFENLDIVRRLKGITDSAAVTAVIDRLRLGEYAKRKAGNLSLGNAQRLGIAKALISEPEILILDEPSNGLDPAGIVEIREMLISLASNKGTTIFISSHILTEVSKIATRIGIIHNGSLIQETDSEKLVQFRKKALLVKALDMEKARRIISTAGHSVELSEEGALKMEGESAINHPEKIAEALVRGLSSPTLLKVEEEDLETYFLRITGGAQ